MTYLGKIYLLKIYLSKRYLIKDISLRNILKIKKIMNNFENEINNFKQVCPLEMLYKLENPITLKDSISKAV